MKNLRRVNWILAAVTWLLSLLFGLSNLMAWESLWMWSGMLWFILMKLSVLVSVCTLFLNLIMAEPEKKKVHVLCCVVVIVISVLMFLPAWFVFQTWSAFR